MSTAYTFKFALNDRVKAMHKGEEKAGTVVGVSRVASHDLPMYTVVFDVYTSFNDGYTGQYFESTLVPA
jgi:hypothetical protein